MDPATMSYAQLLEAYQALQARLSALEGTMAVQPQAPAWGHAAPHTALTRELVSVPEACLEGGGEMGRRIRAFDWSSTPVGPVAEWPQSLLTAVSICQASRFPIVIYWGAEYVTLYNDAYSEILAKKHPGALGRRAREVWAEIWDVISPMLDSVRVTGQATWSDDLLLLLERHGYPEECYFSFSFSPVRGEHGQIGGVFTAVTETTQRVIGERRLRTLRDLAAGAGEAKSGEEACQVAVATMAGNPADLPFALLYLCDAEGKQAQMVGLTGLAPDTPASSRLVDLTVSEPAPQQWPLGRVARTAQTEIVSDLEERFGPLPGGPWPESPHTALILPISSPTQGPLAGLLVAGVSPRRALDDAYRGFLELVAGQVATAIANARAYEEERRRAEALAELDRAKTAFFSNVSHEFRTPLTLMLGPLEHALANGHGALTPPQRAELEVVHRNGLRLLKLVNTLLDFSRLEAGRVEASYEPTDLAAVTADLASVFRSAIKRAGLGLAVECSALPEVVYVDRDMWEKIVLNLLSNAFKFTFAGEIAVSLSWGGDHVALRVRDTGTGIPEHELPHLFERFHRIPNARARTHEGTGIGLALVQELVRLHGGEITVVSAVGVGTTFTVTLPTGTAHLPADRVGAARRLASTALGVDTFVEEALRWLPDAPAGVTVAVSEVMPAPPDSRTTTSVRILLVDDNADMRDYVRRLLSQHWEVVAAADGLEALEVARTRVPDLVLADVMMPGLDGFALLRALRADPRTAPIPVLLLSARAGEESRVEGLEAGADDYLIKPFSAQELLARVEAHLKLKRLRDEMQAALLEHAAQLESALEELRTREEELRQQHDQLLMTRLEVERERARYAALFALAPDAYLVTDTAGVIYEANHVAAALLSVSAQHLVGKPLSIYVAPVDRQAFRTQLTRLQTQERVQNWEMQLQPRHGSLVPVSITVAASPSAPGQTPSLHWLLRDDTVRQQAEAALRAHAEVVETINRVGQTLAAELDLEKLVQAVTDAATALTGAQFGAFFYNVSEAQGESYMLYTLSGAAYEQFARFPIPRNTALFEPTFRGTDIVRIPDVMQDPRYGQNAPYYGLPPGHLPVTSYLAVPVVSRSGEVLGGLFFGHPEADVFTDRHERIVVGLAAQAAVAMDNARLFAAAQHELTARQQLAESLRESEQRFRQMIDALPAAIYTTDAEGRLTHFNPAAVEFSGRVPELGADQWCVSWQLYYPDGMPMPHDECPMAIALTEGRTVRGVEAMAERPDGTRIWFTPYPTPLRDRAGRIVGGINMLVDVTERKQAEAALRELNATLEQRIEERTALLALIQDVTRAANEAASSTEALQYAVDRLCAYTGWPVGHVYLAVAPGADRWAPTTIWHLDDPERFAAFQQATQGLEVVASANLIGQVGCGQQAWLCEVATDPAFQRRHAAQAAGLRTGMAWPLLVGQEVAGVLEFYTPEVLAPHPALLEAMTQVGTQLGRAVERERAAAQAQRQQEALLQHEKLAAMSTMLASVAHELNNPLASIVLQTALLEEDLRDDPLAEPVAEITQAAARCERLVRQFLTLARQHPPERTAVALNTLVAETVELLAYPFRVDDVAVHLHLDEQVPPLWGDPHQLQQVLLNLLTNAQHALRAVPGAREVICTTQYDSAQQQIMLAVADTGPGIATALQARIFEPFFTTKPPGVGTGLGLPLCRGIVEAHGGALAVSSALGQGATFRITLPAGAVPAAPPVPSSATEVPVGRSQTILVVEDEPSLASGLVRLLRRDGHSVETVANGRLALARLEARAYDLILCDVRMPELDGPSLYRLLERQQPHLCRRVIFLTGDTLEPATHAFLEASGAPCLLKPFAIAEARRVIQRTLQGAALSTPRTRPA